jgi:hypothetical protein
MGEGPSHRTSYSEAAQEDSDVKESGLRKRGSSTGWQSQGSRMEWQVKLATEGKGPG